jgi:pimeloyl-ACP methyl ester carboxylesterase
MAEIVANGVRFHLQRLTPRQRPSQLKHPVIFIHGLVMDNLSSFYFTLGNSMANAGADVIMYDQRGHGLSDRPPTGYRLSDSVADLTGLLDGLGIDGPVHLVGNSYGGTVALGFAAEYPERVASMVLIEARIPIAGWADQMTTAIKKIESDLTGEFGRWVSQSRNRARLAARGNKLIHHTTFINDLIASETLSEEQLRMFTTPVLAVYGSQSDILHHGYILNDLLSQYALTILPGVNHLVLTEAPRMVRSIVLDWFMTETNAMLTSPL